MTTQQTTAIPAEEVRPGDVLVYGTLTGTTVRCRVATIDRLDVVIHDPATRSSETYDVIRLGFGYGESLDYAPDFPVEVTR